MITLSFLMTLVAAVFALYWLGYGRPVVHIVSPKVPDSGSSEPRDTRSIVFLSSDMGPFVGLGTKLIGALSAAGHEVIVLNTLKFLSFPKSVSQKAEQIGALIELAADGDKPVILIAQSFGADMLLSAALALKARHRKLIDRIILIVPSQKGYLRATPAEAFNFSAPKFDLSPGACALSFAPVYAIGAMMDSGSLHHLASADHFTWRVMPSGHFLKDHGSVIDQTLSWIA